MFLREIHRLLQRPHPFIFGPLSYLVPALATFALIAMLGPFGFGELDAGDRLIWAAGLALLVAGSVAAVVKGLQWGRPRWMDAEKWTLGKEMALVLAVLMVIAMLVFGLLWAKSRGTAAPGTLLLQVLWRTLGISFFPLLVLILIEQFFHQRRSLQQARELTRQLEAAPIAPPETQHVLVAENGKPALQLQLDDLIFLQSSGNYVEVHHRDASGRVHKDLIRNRLKALASELPGDRFFQSHKSYVVNVQHIRKVRGNARNYVLQLQFEDLEIPVARSRSAELNEFLNRPAQAR